ncbi:hypothetical protein KIN20_008659 [Parelaphostrongylus tenuis]|uniref:Uncharacterized protein n=1 Tax=Parelaphostrongylus tenuis TaxID=148309 RepID=A0AAD5MPC8_PARTN|nr:hypothetical protein KIN20_008659 [Parelaphostrongylus tenuis]
MKVRIKGTWYSRQTSEPKDVLDVVHAAESLSKFGFLKEEDGLEVEEEEAELPIIEKTFVPIAQSTITTIESPFAIIISRVNFMFDCPSDLKHLYIRGIGNLTII